MCIGSYPMSNEGLASTSSNQLFSVDVGIGIVTHHVDISLFPNWQGHSQIGRVMIEAGRLSIIASDRTSAAGPDLSQRSDPGRPTPGPRPLIWRAVDPRSRQPLQARGAARPVGQAPFVEADGGDSRRTQGDGMNSLSVSKGVRWVQGGRSGFELRLSLPTVMARFGQSRAARFANSQERGR